jgi:tetratricopeptide (TPR) repeat protein
MPENIEQLQHRLGSVPPGGERIEILVELGIQLQPLDLERARGYIDEALELLRIFPDDRRMSQALRSHAFCDMLVSRNQEALATLEHARELTIACGDVAGQASTTNLIGSIHKSLGDSIGSLSFYLESLGLYEQTGDRVGLGGVLNNIGNAYKSLGDFTSALEFHLRSLDIAIETGNRIGEASVLNNIGNIHINLEDLPKAHDYYMRSLAIKEELGDRRALGNSLGNLGLLYAALGDYDRAVEYHLRGLEHFHTAGDLEGEANSLCNLSVAWCEKGEAERALGYGTEALALTRRIGDREGESVALLGIGNACRASGEFAGAVARMSEALEIAVELEARPLIEKIHLGLFTALRESGDMAAALDHLRTMCGVAEEIASAEARRSITNREHLYAVDRARRDAEIERLRNVELARTLRELESAQAELVQAEKMAYIGHLTAGVTDQARHPVAAIDRALGPLAIAAGELLELGRRCNDAIDDGPEAFERSEPMIRDRQIEELLSEIIDGLGRIEEEAVRTSAIVEGLRAFSRLDEGALKLADIDEGIRALLTLVRNRCQGRIAIDYDAGDIPSVECYPGSINQAVLALVSEAIDTIDGEGAITIATRSAVEEVEIVIASRRTATTGRGGNGEVDNGDSLAITVARETLRKHNGELAVVSRGGTEWETRLRLPIRQPRTRRENAPSEKGSPHE